MTRITLPPLEPYKAPFSSTSVDDAGAANAICGNGEKRVDVAKALFAFVNLFDVSDVAAVAAAPAAAAAVAVTDAVDVDDDVHDVDNDLILFNLGQLNFKPQFGFFALLSLFVGSLANGHLLQHFVEWAELDDD